MNTDTWTQRTSELSFRGMKAQTRHSAVMAELLKLRLSLQKFLQEVPVQRATLNSVLPVLAKSAPKPHQPIFGSLPYKHLNLPARAPKMDPVVAPAYDSGQENYTPDDLVGTPEAPTSKMIAELAQSLE